MNPSIGTFLCDVLAEIFENAHYVIINTHAITLQT